MSDRPPVCSHVIFLGILWCHLLIHSIIFFPDTVVGTRTHLPHPLGDHNLEENVDIYTMNYWRICYDL